MLHQLSAGLNVPKYSIRRLLLDTNNLLKYDFVTFDSANKTYSGNTFSQEMLEVIASKIGTSGKSEKVKLRFQRDREIRANLKIGEVREVWLNRRWQREQNEKINTASAVLCESCPDSQFLQAQFPKRRTNYYQVI